MYISEYLCIFADKIKAYAVIRIFTSEQLHVSFKQGFISPKIPIATFHQGDKELVLLLDTGSDKNVIVPFCLGKNARKYYKEPIICNFVSYGSNIVVATTKEVSDLVTEYIGKFEFYHCFETPNMHWLNDRLLERGHKVCFMAEYYLPDVNKIPDAECLYETHILVQEDFKNLYLPEWSCSP